MNVGETFYAFKKKGELGNAFKVANDRGQLGKSSLLVLCGPYTKRLLFRFGLYSRGIKIVSCSDIINAEYSHRL